MTSDSRGAVQDGTREGVVRRGPREPLPFLIGRAKLCEVGVWQFPAGIYMLSIWSDERALQTRRILVGDRRRRCNRVDVVPIALEHRHHL